MQLFFPEVKFTEKCDKINNVLCYFGIVTHSLNVNFFALLVVTFMTMCSGQYGPLGCGGYLRCMVNAVDFCPIIILSNGVSLRMLVEAVRRECGCGTD